MYSKSLLRIKIYIEVQNRVQQLFTMLDHIFQCPLISFVQWPQTNHLLFTYMFFVLILVPVCYSVCYSQCWLFVVDARTVEQSGTSAVQD